MKAYRYFYPEIFNQLGNDFGTVSGSPLQYSYRTKLTLISPYLMELILNLDLKLLIIKENSI